MKLRELQWVGVGNCTYWQHAFTEGPREFVKPRTLPAEEGELAFRGGIRGILGIRRGRGILGDMQEAIREVSGGASREVQPPDVGLFGPLQHAYSDS